MTRQFRQSFLKVTWLRTLAASLCSWPLNVFVLTRKQPNQIPSQTALMEPRRNTFRFCDIPIGARFIHKGRVFFKLAKSMAEDEDRVGAIFQDETPVEVGDASNQTAPDSENPS